MEEALLFPIYYSRWRFLSCPTAITI